MSTDRPGQGFWTDFSVALGFVGLALSEGAQGGPCDGEGFPKRPVMDLDCPALTWSFGCTSRSLRRSERSSEAPTTLSTGVTACLRGAGAAA